MLDSTIYDPIWGDIKLTQCERDLIKTKAFKRLLHIKQMSLAYIGHIGAQHTRFEHSVGCLYVADFLIKNINIFQNDYHTREALYSCIDREFISSNGEIEDNNIIKHFRIAALLHDIGHAPLSHLIESAIEKSPIIIDALKMNSVEIAHEFGDINPLDGYGHERFSAWIIYNDREISKIFTEFGIQKDWIVYLLDEASCKDIGANIPPVIKMLKPLISGDFDADRIDYINRDFYHCGIKGVVDLSLYSQSLKYYSRTSSSDDLCVVVNRTFSLELSNLLFQKLLLARRVHNESKTKTNEQILISVLQDFLLSLSVSKRLTLLKNLHTQYRDYDIILMLQNFLNTAEESKIYYRINIDDILDGRSANNVRNYIIPMHQCSPLLRYSAHLIVDNKHLLRLLEDNLNALTKDNSLVVDTVYNKPSNMEIISVGYENNDVRSLLDDNNSCLPHALYEGGINSLQIVVYSLKSHNNEVLKKNVESSLNSILIKHLSEICVTSIPLELFILIIYEKLLKHFNEALLGYCKDYLKMLGDAKVKGDTRFHYFIYTLLSELHYSVIPSPRYNERMFSHVILRASENIVHWGLVDHIHRSVKVGTDENYYFTKRVDRMVNGWGMQFLEQYVYPYIDKTIVSSIENLIAKKQNNVIRELKEILQLSSEKKSETTEKRNRRKEIEDYVRNMGGCVLKVK